MRKITTAIAASVATTLIAAAVFGLSAVDAQIYRPGNVGESPSSPQTATPQPTPLKFTYRVLGEWNLGNNACKPIHDSANFKTLYETNPDNCGKYMDYLLTNNWSIRSATMYNDDMVYVLVPQGK